VFWDNKLVLKGEIDCPVWVERMAKSRVVNFIV